MKLRRALVSSALLLSVSLSVLANTASDVGDSIKFVVNGNNISVNDANYSYKNFLYDDFSATSSNNDTINTFSPNLNGPYPGQGMTYGRLGVFVQTGEDDVCRVSLKTILISDGQHPINFYSYSDTIPSVKAESKKYACAAYFNGKDTVNIDVVPVS